MTVREAVGRVAWYLREVSGENDYDRHVEHLRRTHPGVPPPSRREFERAKMAERERNPRARCC
jgi:uncharacterized short protein YbdD (DUF466 family)